MADHTMEELLQAPTEGYGEAIVILEILAENFEIKTNLLQLVQTNKFHGFKRDNPHTHIGNFKRMTSTLKYRDVPNDSIKLMLFPYSLEGAARIWYEKEPPNSILTWDDLTFREAWERFKEILRACPHHGFSELTQIDTFYNGLNEQDQDSLNVAAGGNLLSKTTREALKIIENKSKVRYSRSKSNVSRVNTNSRDSSSKTDDRIDKLADQISNLVEIVNKQVITPATAKAVEKTYVICEGAHAYYDFIATDSNQPSVCAATSTYNQVSPPNRASNQIPPPCFAPVQNNQNRYAVLTGRVVVLTGRYVVPADISFCKQESLLCLACDYISYSPSLQAVKIYLEWDPTSGTDNESDDASVHSQATNAQQQPNIQPQIITTVSNNNAKFPYFKKDEYDVWDMKMEYWITNNDMNIWKRESKERTTLLQYIPDDHVTNFHYMDDARDIWNAVKARFGGNAESKKMRNSMLKQEFSEFKIGEAEGLHKGQSVGPSHSAFVSATSASKKMSYRDSLSYSSNITYSASSNSKTGSHRSSNVLEDVLQSFVADTEPEQQLKAGMKIDFDKRNLIGSTRRRLGVSIGRRPDRTEPRPSLSKTPDREPDRNGTTDLTEDHFGTKPRTEDRTEIRSVWSDRTVHLLTPRTDHGDESDEVITAKEFGMIVGCDSKDAIKEGAAKIYNLITGANLEEANTAGDAGEFALMGVTSERNSSKNLFRLIDSSMSVRTKVGLEFNDCIRENKLGWDDFAFSVFTTNFEDVEGRPLFHSDKSSDVNTNDFASSDFSVKSSEHKPNDSTSSVSTSSVFTSVNEAEIESNIGTPIQEPIIVQDLPSLSCNSSDKNEHTSRTSCNTNGYFNKKVGHLRKHASSVSKVDPVYSWNKVNHQNPFIPQAVLLRTGKVNIPPSRPQPVPTGKPKVFSPVPTGIDGQLLLSPYQVVLRNHIKKVYTRYPRTIMDLIHLNGQTFQIHKENPFLATEDEEIFDSGCSRSITGNKKRLDDIQKFQGGKVTFGSDTECLVLSKDFKLPDDSMVVLKVPRKQNLYTINLNNLCPRGNLACLVAHALFDESVKWHRWMGHVNYKNINILVKGNLVRGLPPKLLKNDHTCVACCKEHKDETYHILKDFINLVENQLNKKEYSNPRTPQQNGVAERKNKTLIEASRTMLADSKLHTMFWTEAVRTACYVLNRVSVTSPHDKTPYALLTGNIPSVSHLKPFGCHVTILNTGDHLGKFDGKADEGYIVGYSASNKAYRGLGHEWYFDLDYLTDSLGYKHVQANQYAGTQRATTNTVGTPDTDSDSDCDEQVIIFHSYPSHNIQRSEPKDTSGDEVDDSPFYSADEIFQKEFARLKGQEQRVTSDAESLGLEFANDVEELQAQTSAKTVPPGSIPVHPGSIPVSLGSIPVPLGSIPVSPGSIPVPTSSIPVPTGETMFLVHIRSSTNLIFNDEPTTRFPYPSDLGNHDPSPSIFSSSSYDDEFGVALNNVASTVEVSPVATKRINIIHPQSLIIGDPTLSVQMRSKALEDPSWVDAMQEEMQQFKFQNVWVLVDLPEGKYAIGTKWILKNKRDARGIVVCNKARLVAQGHRQEEGIDYDEVLAPVAKIEAIRLFLAFASYMGFLVYQMDVKSAFLYGRIDKEVYVTQPKGSVDPQHPKKVYKTLFLKKNNRDIILVQVYVDDIIFRSTKKVWCDEFEALIKGEFQMSVMGELTFFLGLQVQQRPDGIFINQDKYVKEILNKFDLGSIRMATTPYEAPKPKSKNESNSPINQTIVATSSTEAEYVAAANCCGQLKTQFFHQRTKHIEIRHHFIRDDNEKKLIQVLKIHTDDNVADLLTKAFDGPSPMVQDDGLVLFKYSTWTRSPELGPPAILATIDKTPYTITEDLVRSRLQLADDGGIANLPIAEIYSGMNNLGSRRGCLVELPRQAAAYRGCLVELPRQAAAYRGCLVELSRQAAAYRGCLVELPRQAAAYRGGCQQQLEEVFVWQPK
nr:retrovirus-related Pol polyprotein from transposon TNT 1-94 [Tanacetum cinerariifolium]